MCMSMCILHGLVGSQVESGITPKVFAQVPHCRGHTLCVGVKTWSLSLLSHVPFVWLTQAHTVDEGAAGMVHAWVLAHRSCLNKCACACAGVQGIRVMALGDVLRAQM